MDSEIGFFVQRAPITGYKTEKSHNTMPAQVLSLRVSRFGPDLVTLLLLEDQG